MKTNNTYFRYFFFILLVIWVLYFFKSIGLNEAVSMSLGALAGTFIGIAMVKWLKSKNKL